MLADGFTIADRQFSRSAFQVCEQDLQILRINISMFRERPKK